MVNFRKLMSRGAIGEAIDPLEVFEKLPKSNVISNLYHVQAEILQTWFTNLRDKQNVVIELNTGGGKTLIGLLMALSTMRELKEGVLYLTENKQLVDQVVSQAESIGIPVGRYAGRVSIDADFANGNKILVGSYQALFNGKSAFGVRGAGRTEPVGGVIIDDAHASLDAIKKAFSFTIPAEKSGGLYRKVLAYFRNAFLEIDRLSTYQEFEDGVGNGVVGIPYRNWYETMETISSCINDLAANPANISDVLKNNLTFNWPLIKDNLRLCQVVVSRVCITISALYPLLDMIPSFLQAHRRIYMSATITDYGDMVRAFDLRSLTEDEIISPRTSAGVGRRMMLSVPKDVLESDSFLAVIKNEVNRGHGVVRLAARRDSEFSWAGLDFETPIGHNEVSKALEHFINGPRTRALSLVNRYNGIDLPGALCTILILEDLPSGLCDVDELTEMYLAESDLIAQRIAQRIEQGAGRGVRGASDHCVVLFVGFRLTDWIKRKANRRFFSGAFTAQLQIGDAICENLDSSLDYCEVIEQELSSDADWKLFHAEELARLIEEDRGKHLGESFFAACSERRAFALWKEHNYGAACNKLTKNAEQKIEDRQYYGWLLYLASRIAFEGRDLDRADNLLQSAHCYNRSLPYTSLVVSTRDEVDCPQAEAIASFILSSLSCDELKKQFDIETASLVFDAKHSDFEESLKALGKYLGFESEKADKRGKGPDVYWVSQEGIAFAIEAKNEKESDNPLHKSEAGQLRTTAAWLQQRYPGYTIVPISVHPNQLADEAAAAGDLNVLLPDDVERLKASVRRLLYSAVEKLHVELVAQLTSALNKEGLTARQIEAQYLRKFITD